MLIPFTSASFTNLSGLAVADGAEVEVRLELNGALAALFDDRAGTTPLTNPFNADSQGRFEFYVAGRIDGYSIQVTKGAQTHTLRHQLTGSAAATLFDNTGTGLVAESVQDAIEEIGTLVGFYPEQFGADGTEANDTAAWAALLTAVGTSNFEIRGKPGSNYLIGAAGITISGKSKGRILANGATITVNALATQSPTGLGATSIYIDGCTKVEFSGWEINGNAKACNVIGMDDSTECVIQGNQITSGGLNGQIFALGNTRCKYLNNECISGIGTARGMWLGNYATGDMENEIEVAGNIVRSMGATGIVCASLGGRVYGNHVEDCSGSGIIFGGANGFSSKRIAIFVNTCRGNSFSGIQSDVVGFSTTADLPYDITIANNVCDENDAAGIYCVHMTQSTVVGNVCRDNSVSSFNAGIIVDDVDGLTVVGNVCHDTRAGSFRTQLHGIMIAAQTNDIDIKNVAISGNVCFNNLENGVFFVTVGAPNTIDNVSVVGNICTNNGMRGILVAEGSAGTVNRLCVTGNVCQGNPTVDLRVDILDAIIANNVYSTQSGIELWTFTDADTTPSVKGRKFFLASNTSATSITAFDDGVDGQEIVIRGGNANTTINHGGLIVTKGAVSRTIPSDGYISFRRENTVWREMFSNF